MAFQNQSAIDEIGITQVEKDSKAADRYAHFSQTPQYSAV